MQLYGIKNCDTVKKAIKWLDANGLNFEFHDYKKEVLSEQLVTEWFQQVDQKRLINRRSTTWRNLSDTQKSLEAESDLIQLIIANPTLVKRPVVLHDGKWSAGFNANDWQSRFS